MLRKPDRVTVEIVNGSGDVVRTLARSRREPSGALQFTWNGRGDNREVVPDGVYRPRVHLADAHKTIVLPNPITMDATPPFIRLVSVAPRVISPDGDSVRDHVRIKYQTSELARAQLYVDGEPRTLVFRFLRAGKIDWPTRPATAQAGQAPDPAAGARPRHERRPAEPGAAGVRALHRAAAGRGCR